MVSLASQPPLCPVLNSSQQLSVRTSWCCYSFKSLDELCLLSLVGQTGVEICSSKTEQPLVLVWGAAVRGLPVLEVGEHGLEPGVRGGCQEETGETPDGVGEWSSASKVW